MPGTIYLSDWNILPDVLTNGGGCFTAPTGMTASLTISNYTLVADNWETNCLRAGTITIQSNGKIYHNWNWATNDPWTPDAGVFIECSNLTVQTGGEINTDGLGYGAVRVYTNGYGPGRGYIDSAWGAGSGAGYGGAGGRESQLLVPAGVSYGTPSNPTNLGSGGGGSFWGVGGAGGGYVKIIAFNTVTVNGMISANGNTAAGGSGRGGGGSGGGILIRCDSLIGNGMIRANGGNRGVAGYGGGGGGGRIALYVRKAPFYTGGNILFTPTAGAGTGFSNGTPGTVYTDYHPRGTVFSMW
jgi:hypothetical protein